MVQVSIYSFHEFAEAGLLPNSEFLHEATEKFSPDGLYGKWFSPIMIGICALWLLGAWLIDRRTRSTDYADNIFASSRFNNFPVGPFGISSTKCTVFGHLKSASRALQ